MQPSRARAILAQVKADYNKIAPHFSRARSRSWPELEIFKKYLKKGDRVLDVGCGNGRLFPFLAPLKVDYTGTDNSEELLKIASRGHPEARFVAGDLMHLPFDDEGFNAVLAVASLHHVPSDPLRTRALEEMRRVLVPGGRLLMSNWHLYQKKYRHYIKGPADGLDRGDAFVPWKGPDGKILAKRYYHAFKETELSQLAARTGFKVVFQGLGPAKEKRNIVSIWEK